MLRTSNLVNRKHPLNQGRLAWWLTVPHLAAGPTWTELMNGNLNPGVLTSMGNSNNGWKPTTRLGGFGHVQFDGSAGIVDIPNTVTGPLAVTNNFTLACWIFVKTTNTFVAGIMCRYRNSNDNSPSMRLGGSGEFSLAGTGSVSGGTVSPGAWYFAAATVAQGSVTLYLNRSVVATGTDTYQVGIGGWCFGQDYSDNSRLLNGYMDDVSIWGRPLSAPEIASYMDLSSRGYPGLLNRRSTLSSTTSPLFRRGLTNRTGSRSVPWKF